MKRLAFFVFALALAGWGSALAQPHPDSTASRARIAAQNTFSQQSNGSAWAIRRHETTEVPVSIFDGPSRALALKGATPEAKAQGFFARHRQMFGYRPAADEFEVESVKERRDFIYVQLKQKYEGIPVHRGGYKVKMTRTGELRMISGRFFPDIDIDVTPGLSASRAGEIATGAIPTDSLVRKPDADLVVYPGEGRYALAYEVRLAGAPTPQSWRVFVDARMGDVLEKENVTRYLASAVARPSSSTPASSPSGSPLPTTGSGKVYLDDPNDGSTSIEDLPRLSGNGSSLTGTYAEAHNYGGTNASPTSSPATYHFSPSNVHFDEVNLYYHVDRYADHLPSIGYPGLGRTIEAYAHWSGCYSGGNCNNAFFDANNTEGNGKQLYFGDGDGIIFQDLAKDNDVIYHEYNHAVLDELNIGYNTYPDETGALQEGTADYLAASFEGNARIGEWVTACSNTGDLRTVSNSAGTFHYSNKSSVEYAYCSTEDQYLNADETRYAVGMIWSGALWDLRGVLGASTTDKLVIEAFNSLNNTPDFFHARDALIQADNDINAGSNTCDIREIFADRGIGKTLIAHVSGPTVLDSGEQGTWTASYECGSGSVSYTWEVRPPGSSTWTSTSGTSQSYSDSFQHSKDQWLDAGVRVTVTRGSDTATAEQTVGIGPSSCSPTPCIATNAAGAQQSIGLRNFRARKQGAETAVLRWKALGKTPPSFVVQHRRDSTTEWSRLGTVSASDSVATDTSRGSTYRFRAEDLSAGTHQFRLRGTATETTRPFTSRKVSAEIRLRETYDMTTYPNPVRNRATVELAVRRTQNVTVAVYDVLGRHVTTLHEGSLPAQETRRFRLYATQAGLSSGTYFVRVRGEAFVSTRRLTVVR